MFKSLNPYRQVSIVPLAGFRFLFGLAMLYSTLRFVLLGWVNELYIEPDFHFKFYGFEWAIVPPDFLVYLIFVLLILSSIGILMGLFYRISAILFFLLFSYVELWDAANYLNHYYFVSLISFLLILLPAHRNFSLDVQIRRVQAYNGIPTFYLWIPKIMLSIVYLYAGIAKLNPDWMIEAMPLKIWLPAKSDLWLIGDLLNYEWIAYAFSWGGAFYDLCIPFLLWNKRTTSIAFALVVFFHLITRLLFPIGVFPLVMILSTTIFLSASFHLAYLNKIFPFVESGSMRYISKVLKNSVVIFFVFQILWPFRFLAYPGSLFWREEGYRLSWRVMLMEKAGYINYKIKDLNTNKVSWINPEDYLTINQHKQLGTQADLILQFAHYLEEEYHKKGYSNIEIYADSYVDLQSKGSAPFIDPTVDLTKEAESFKPKTWILKAP